MRTVSRKSSVLFGVKADFWVHHFMLMSTFKVFIGLLLCGSRARAVSNVTLCLVLEEDSYYITYQRVAGIVDIGISQANLFVLPDEVKFNSVYINAGPSCSSYQYTVVSAVLKSIREGTVCHAFLGVGCPTTANALYGVADNLNIPILGVPAAGAGAINLAQRSSGSFNNGFPLLLRIPFGFGDLSDFLMAFFRKYNYSHVSIFRDDSLTYFSLMSNFIISQLRTEMPLVYARTREYPFFSHGVTNGTYTAMLQQASDFSRVIIILTNGNIVRDFMIAAYQLQYTNGEYVFVAVELYDLVYWGSIKWGLGDRQDFIAKDAFSSLLIVSIYQEPDDAEDEAFQEKVKRLARARYNYTFQPLEPFDPVMVGYYEAVMVYAQETSNMFSKGLNFLNGSLMASRIDATNYNGIGGLVRMGDDGERNREFELRGFNDDKGKFEGVMRFLYIQDANGTRDFHVVKDFHWDTENGALPPDVPRCGFRGELCVDRGMTKGTLTAAILVPILVVMGLIGSAVYAYIYFKKFRKDYDPNWWRIKADDLFLSQKRAGSQGSRKTLRSQSTKGSALSSIMSTQPTAMYNGTAVSVSSVESLKKSAAADVAACLTLLKPISHANLQRVIGISINNLNICEHVVEEICSKGSVTDILHNDIIKLDWSFKNSLIKDIVQGMAYLHSTPVISHGNLTSDVCLVDTRFTLKISDFGLPCFRAPEFLRPFKDTEMDRSYEPLLWRPPELLRQTMPAQGTQRGDVYSFAVLLQQIILRSGPFELPNDPLDLSEREILREVVAANIPPVRPRVPRSSCSNELYDLMEKCWEEIPLDRPTFAKIKERLKRVVGDIGDNIVDLLFKRMEQYAADLELKVAEKTQQFMDEKNRSEQLLSQLLPKPVAAALTRGEHLDPEAYESVSIYFSDIVGFTTLSASATPMEVINLLNNLYTFFDGIIEKFDVYKVETIGDAYMVSSGLPVRNGNRHAAEIANMALKLMNGVSAVEIPNRPQEQIRIRIGINSGPCVAGIVGLKMPRYCLFGDTVNVASRMESTGEPMKVQITESCKALLDSIGGFRTGERGPVTVKGKGTMITFWLLG